MQRVGDECQEVRLRNAIIIEAKSEDRVSELFHAFVIKYAEFVAASELLLHNKENRAAVVYESAAWKSFYVLPSKVKCSDKPVVVVFSPIGLDKNDLWSLWMYLGSYVADLDAEISCVDLPEDYFTTLRNVAVYALAQCYISEDTSFVLNGNYTGVTRSDMLALNDMVNYRLSNCSYGFTSKKDKDGQYRITVKTV